jgi:hypothetical protein
VTIVDLKSIDVVLLLDGSGSMSPDMWADEQKAGGLLLREMSNRTDAPFGAAVIQYASGPATLEQNYTKNISDVADLLENANFTQAAGKPCTWYGTALAKCVTQLEDYGSKSKAAYR